MYMSAAGPGFEPLCEQMVPAFFSVFNRHWRSRQQGTGDLNREVSSDDIKWLRVRFKAFAILANGIDAIGKVNIGRHTRFFAFL